LKSVSKRILSLATSMLFIMVLTLFPAIPAIATSCACGTQQIVVQGYDWGPAVTKIILTMNVLVDSNSINKNSFTVKTTVEGIKEAVERTVSDAYICDASGNKTCAIRGNMIALDMEVVKSDTAGNPFFYNQWYNEWADPYTNAITATGLRSNCVPVSVSINPQPISRIVPILSQFSINNKFTASDNTTLNYAFHKPAADCNKHPLVIWLHGMGEGFTGGGSEIPILGANLSNLVSDKFQSIMGGAYLLIPQANTYWMDDGVAPMSMSTGGTHSIYETSLWELIQCFEKNHSDIDTNRIIIGGCSNGGYMTMNMIFLHPDYFAAAFPICAPYENQYVTDCMINSIKNLPIRYTQALGDELVNPLDSITIFNRLIEAGSKVAQISLFGPIEDSMGNKGSEAGYIQHFSWVFALDDSYNKALTIPAHTDTEEGGSAFGRPGFTFQLEEPNNQTSLWCWLANQTK